tara:strand:+ start:204 stop:746 length:543 start_codon:yes stop_codon:yes gene_type:complete
MASQLRVDSIVPVDGVPTGGGGGIVQVKKVVMTSAYSDNTSSGALWNFNNALLRCDITAKKASNLFIVNGVVSVGSNGLAVTAILYDNGSIVTSAVGDSAGDNKRRTTAGGGACPSEGVVSIPINVTFSPGDTNEHKYHFAFFHNSGSQQYIHLNRSHGDQDSVSRGRYISTITIMEVST